METPFEVDHMRPRSRGGSNRISNLALACHGCNQQKGNQTAAEWGHPEVEKQAKVPLRDAAAVKATRYKLFEALRVLGLTIRTRNRLQTKHERERLANVEKDARDE